MTGFGLVPFWSLESPIHSKSTNIAWVIWAGGEAEGIYAAHIDIFSDLVTKMVAVIDQLDKSMERREKILQKEKGQ